MYGNGSPFPFFLSSKYTPPGAKAIAKKCQADEIAVISPNHGELIFIRYARAALMRLPTAHRRRFHTLLLAQEYSRQPATLPLLYVLKHPQPEI